VELVVSEEVRAALAAGGPVVALESSVIAQGLPPPHNLEAARACELAIRAVGAVPATIALSPGRLHVGCDDALLEALADPASRPAKAGAADLAPLLAAGRFAGTTVAGTLAVAARVGLRLFATGGLGGVHRGAFGAAPTLDVSADLPALASHPVAVVCAGAKAILDLPGTLEALETLSVPVVGLGVAELPAFYGNRSGLPLQHRVDDEAAAAKLLTARWGLLGQLGGVVFARPVPEEAAIPAALVEEAVGRALAAAQAAGVQGKAVTPFLLGRLAAEPALHALSTNVAVLTANAASAGRIAVALARHEKSASDVEFPPAKPR